MRNVKYEDQIAAFLKSQPGVTFYYRDILKMLDLPDSGGAFTRAMKMNPEIARVRRGFYRWNTAEQAPAAAPSTGELLELIDTDEALPFGVALAQGTDGRRYLVVCTA